MNNEPCDKSPIEFGIVDLSELSFKKSSLSMGNGNCVEVAHTPGRYVMRDSKDTAGPTLQFTSDEWNAFIGGIQNGEFDSLLTERPA
jgi:hypothetical protein